MRYSGKRSHQMSMRTNLVWLCAVALLALPLLAQDVPIIRQGVTEVGGFVGASYGIDQARVMGGGNVVYSLTKTFMPFGEVSYFPGIGRTQSVTGIPGATETFSVPLADFNFGFHLRVPIPKSRIIPYAVISIGGIHSPQRSVTATFPNPVNPGQIITTPPFQVNSSTDFTFSGGCPLRRSSQFQHGFCLQRRRGHPLLRHGTAGLSSGVQGLPADRDIHGSVLQSDGRFLLPVLKKSTGRIGGSANAVHHRGLSIPSPRNPLGRPC